MSGEPLTFVNPNFEARFSALKPEIQLRARAALDKMDSSDRIRAELILEILQNKEDLRNWARTFFKIELPSDTLDDDSNSNPLDAMWRIYEAVRDNKGDEISGFIMLSAREAYKCQAKGSKLLTPNGLKNIEDANIGDEVWTGFSWQKITNHICDGIKDGISVNVSMGPTFVGSPIHRYWVLREGKEQWIRSDKLDPKNDLIAVNIDTGLSNTAVRNKESYEIGHFLGMLAGDGGVSSIDSKTHKHFAFTTIDPDLKEIFFNFVKKHWNCNINTARDGITYCVWKEQAIDSLKKWGVLAKRSWEKTIPSYCYQDIDSMKGFISGLFDTDGSFCKRGDFVLSITSLELLQEVQKSLISFGIWSTVRSNKRMYSNQKHLVHTLTISRTDFPNLKKCGIKITAKKANIFKNKTKPDSHNNLPKKQIQWFLDLCDSYGYVQIRHRKYLKKSHGQYPNISVSRLETLCSWMEENYLHGFVSEEDNVKTSEMRKILRNKWRTFSVQNIDNVEFYDLTVENDHSYWSNGSISHNTLSASMLEVLLLLHFQVSISHMAAILKQSDKAVSYINAFFTRLEPYITTNGWKKESDSKTKIQFVTPEDIHPYIVIIVCTVAGANSEHTPLMFVDEVDVVSDPNAYEEAKFIPSMERGRFPLTVKLSTRKFAFGLMQKELDAIKDTEEVLLQWNVMDITERCPQGRHLPDPDGKMFTAYAQKKLPLRTVTKEDVDALPENERNEYFPIEGHPGCLKCPLFSVCRGRLANKPETSTGNLYRPIAATIKSFKKVSPDKGEAQLMCWRPSTKGLVYPRFDQVKNKISIDEAYKLLTGEDVKDCSMIEFILLLKRLEAKIYAGVDWGYVHEATIVIMAVCPAGFSFILESFGSPGLEVESEFLPKAVEMNEKYGVDKWFCDQAAPGNIKTFSKKFGSSKVPEFKKEVLTGIECIRGQILDSSNTRRLLVIDAKKDDGETYNHKILEGFKVHHFLMDLAGNPTKNPDDEEFADVMDALRYIGQNVFAPKSSGKILVSTESTPIPVQQRATGGHGEQLRMEIAKRVTEVVENTGEARKSKGKIFWDF